MASGSIYIAIDAMGGDFGPRITVPAALMALERNADIEITLFGSEDEIRKVLPQTAAKPPERLSIIHCDESIAMDEKPSSALKRGKQTSLFRAVESLTQSTRLCKAVVSAGNTGAFMAIGKHLLGMFHHIDRPAICARLPSANERTWVLDLGANIDSTPEMLYQYAQMGTVLVRTLENLDRPEVALLNVGSEQGKGHDTVRLAAEKMKASAQLNYVGFVEGNDVFTGNVDIVVCDGFVGNTLIKASQGLARLISGMLLTDLDKTQREYMPVIAGFVEAFCAQIDPCRYNGASLLGLNSTAVVSHGSANANAFAHAIELAACESKLELPLKLSSHFNQ
ncbi:MAG: phosphate acyltransferase PlsX [Pseudomonadales bacterium]|nr:phosphate acyltransferase PlsX [Pseudomonadales bacterium]